MRQASRTAHRDRERGEHHEAGVDDAPDAGLRRARAFGPIEFLEKLAVLIPKPRVNLPIYHGIFGARARQRPAKVASAGSSEAAPPTGADSSATPKGGPSRRSLTWAELLRRIFAIDVLACVCGARLRFVATSEDPPVGQRILRHLGLPTEIPMAAPARPPPGTGADLAFDFPS